MVSKYYLEPVFSMRTGSNEVIHHSWIHHELTYNRILYCLSYQVWIAQQLKSSHTLTSLSVCSLICITHSLLLNTTTYMTHTHPTLSCQFQIICAVVLATFQRPRHHRLRHRQFICAVALATVQRPRHRQFIGAVALAMFQRPRHCRPMHRLFILVVALATVQRPRHRQFICAVALATVQRPRHRQFIGAVALAMFQRPRHCRPRHRLFICAATLATVQRPRHRQFICAVALATVQRPRHRRFIGAVALAMFQQPRHFMWYSVVPISLPASLQYLKTQTILQFFSLPFNSSVNLHTLSQSSLLFASFLLSNSDIVCVGFLFCWVLHYCGGQFSFSDASLML